MEQRDANLIVGKAGGTSGKNAKTYKISIPSSWIHDLDLSEENRSITLAYDGEQIIIKPKKKETDGHKILKLFYYDKDRLCSVIQADYTSETIQVVNYCDNPVKTAFGMNRKPTWEQYQEFLASRCVPRERAGLREYLETIGVAEYDPLSIIRVTQGKMAEDGQWIAVEEDII